LKFGSLFSGIGGFDLGFEQAGLSCEWQVEIDKDCNRVLENRFRDVRRFADVKDVGKLPTVDVICGGFPCQDLSVAGKRAGLAGERSGLWFEFLRIIKSNLPRWIVIENVPGLLSSDEGRDFAAILRGLVECGYSLAWRILDAQYAGVAQRRRRVFIVGSLGDGSCAEILFESESVSWNPPTRREAGAGVARTIKGGARGNGTKNEAEDAMNLQVCGAVSGKWAKGTGGPAGDEAYNLVSMPLKSKANSSHDESHETYVAAPITLSFAKHHGRTAGNNGEADNLVVNCFNGYTGEPDDNDAQANHVIAWALHSQNSYAMTGNGDARAAERADKVRALDGGAGFTAGQGGNLIQQFEVRRLTPRECERLQGFPDDWTLSDSDGKEISDSARYRMLGNAVCVNVARWIGKRIMEVIR
jgi:DNA (cytosine-5)-methyltransferase 1